jgi:hypothetical protein
MLDFVNRVGASLLHLLIKTLVAAAVLIYGTVIFIGSIMFFVLLGPAVGALAGYIIGHVPYVDMWVLNGLRLVGLNITAPDLVPLGAALGFVGGFFKTKVPAKKKAAAND